MPLWEEHQQTLLRRQPSQIGNAHIAIHQTRDGPVRDSSAFWTNLWYVGSSVTDKTETGRLIGSVWELFPIAPWRIRSVFTRLTPAN